MIWDLAVPELQIAQQNGRLFTAKEIHEIEDKIFSMVRHKMHFADNNKAARKTQYSLDAQANNDRRGSESKIINKSGVFENRAMRQNERSHFGPSYQNININISRSQVVNQPRLESTYK